MQRFKPSRAKWKKRIYAYRIASSFSVAFLLALYFHPFASIIQSGEHIDIRISDSTVTDFRRDIVDTKSLQKVKPSNQFPPNTPEALRRYIQWHAAKVKCMKDSSCDGEKPKILLWKCQSERNSCEGTGSRFKGVMFALMFAIITERVLFINWPSYPFPFSSVVEPSYIDWRLPMNLNTSSWPTFNHIHWPKLKWDPCLSIGFCRRNVSITESNERGKVPKHSTIDLSSDDIKYSLNQFQYVTIQTTQFTFVNLLLNPFAKTGLEELNNSPTTSLQLKRSTLQVLFKPSATVTNILDLLIPKDTRRKGYIAVHARIGHDFSEPDTSSKRFAGWRASEDLLAEKLLKCASTIYAHETYPLFLASDSVLLKRSIANKCKERNIRLIYSKLPAVHIGIVNGVPQDMTEIEAWKAFLNVFVEFFGMANAKAVINNQSYFSLMAFIMGNASIFKEFSLSNGC